MPGQQLTLEQGVLGVFIKTSGVQGTLAQESLGVEMALVLSGEAVALGQGVLVAVISDPIVVTLYDSPYLRLAIGGVGDGPQEVAVDQATLDRWLAVLEDWDAVQQEILTRLQDKANPPLA